MIRRLLQWVRDNKLATLLIAVLGFVLFTQTSPRPMGFIQNTQYRGAMMDVQNSAPSLMQKGSPASYGSAQETADMIVPPASGGGSGGSTPADKRMVSRNAYLSLVVQDVQTALTQMTGATTAAGGYVITSSISDPEGNAYATLSVRVLSESLDGVLASFKKLGVKTVSENVEGTDITDQFKDTQEHLRVLVETKAKFEALLRASDKVGDSLSVLREVQQLQYQIDQLEGEKRYLAESAKYSRITANLSTDEYELPYAPQEPWSAAAVFKNAVRELIRTLRGYAEKAIWIAVYAVIWVPALVLAFFLYRRFIRKLI